MNSREKGKRIERDACAFLASIGFAARRSAQHCGKAGQADIEVDSLPMIHFEIKGNEGIDIGTKLLADACAQADRDRAKNTCPVVLWKRNRTKWRLTYPLRVDRDYEAWTTLTDSEGIRRALIYMNGCGTGEEFPVTRHTQQGATQ